MNLHEHTWNRDRDTHQEYNKYDLMAPRKLSNWEKTLITNDIEQYDLHSNKHSTEDISEGN